MQADLVTWTDPDFRDKSTGLQQGERVRTCEGKNHVVNENAERFPGALQDSSGDAPQELPSKARCSPQAAATKQATVC